MAECRSCQAPIVWVRTERKDGQGGKNMPLDAAVASDDEIRPRAYPDGNIEKTGKFIPGRFGQVAEVRYVPAGPGLYKSHFATCPDASQHRRR